MWSPTRKALGRRWRRLPRRVACRPPVRRRRQRAGRRRADRVVRRRPAARLRLVVPAARRTRQRRLRGAARRQPQRQGRPAICGQACSTVPTFAAALGPGATPEGRHLAWPIPARIDRATLAHGPVLFTGDAAAATDVMTGEGIGQALLTGRLAAAAIVAGRDHRRTAERYRQRGARRARRRPSACRCSSGVCCGIAAAPTGRWPSSPTPATWGRRNFARWMFEDEPRAIAVDAPPLAPPVPRPPRRIPASRHAGRRARRAPRALRSPRRSNVRDARWSSPQSGNRALRTKPGQ